MDALFAEAEKKITSKHFEIFSQSWDDDSIDFEMDRIKQIKSQNITGYGLRFIEEGRIGFATATGEGCKDLVDRALGTVTFGPKANFDFPGTPPPPSPVQIFDPMIEGLTLDTMEKKGEEILAYLKERKPAFQYDISIERSSNAKEIRSHALDLAYRQTAYSFSVASAAFLIGQAAEDRGWIKRQEFTVKGLLGLAVIGGVLALLNVIPVAGPFLAGIIASIVRLAGTGAAVSTWFSGKEKVKKAEMEEEAEAAG